MTEVWLPVVGYGGRYEVSDLGRVRSVARSTLSSNNQIRSYKSVLLKPGIDSGGYQIIALLTNGSQRMVRVHVLVLEAFAGPRPPRYDACHNNGIKTDNRASNLRWDSRRNNLLENIRWGVRTYQKRTA